MRLFFYKLFWLPQASALFFKYLLSVKRAKSKLVSDGLDGGLLGRVGWLPFWTLATAALVRNMDADNDFIIISPNLPPEINQAIIWLAFNVGQAGADAGDEN